MDKLRLASEWISVEDRLPEGECIAYDALNQRVAAGYRSRRFPGVELYDGKDDCDVTLWMPLPASPEVNEAQGE